MPKDKVEMGLLNKSNGLATTQEKFAKKHALKLYGEVAPKKGPSAARRPSATTPSSKTSAGQAR